MHCGRPPTITVSSWKPVIKVEVPVVPISPLTMVLVPMLVIPEPPPKPPKSAMVGPRTMGGGTTAAPVVKVQGFGTPVFPSGLPARSVAPSVTVAVYVVLAVNGNLGVSVAMKLTAS